MKRVLTFCFLIGLPVAIAAQETPTKDKHLKPHSKDNIFLGASLGFTYNTLTYTTGYRAFSKYSGGVGLTAGVPFQYKFFEWLSLYAEPSYISKSYSFERTDPNVNYTERNWTNHYVQLPIAVQFSFGSERLRGFVNLGEFTGFWAASHIKGVEQEATTNSSSWETLQGRGMPYSYSENVQFDKERDNRFEAGVWAGLGLRYEIPFCMFVWEARYYYSITDMQKDYMINQSPRYNNTLTFQFSVLFNLNRK
ncbi:MAG: PorT family protein [Bacteroidales bacterium]|jgi:hypothetical protein|nr:PorT family protein [Bacteroidales bacterium]